MNMKNTQISKDEIKKTGATFTPIKLAEFLADKLLAYTSPKAMMQILDPACGEGELLKAIGKKLTENEHSFNLIGYDSNEHYLSKAETELQEMDRTFINQDFLESIHFLSDEQLEFDYDRGEKRREYADIVIANPPYVRTQHLGSEKAQELAARFKLKGRVDLYHPFLIAMTEALKPGGLIGVITSNKFIFNKSGESIRNYLSEHYDILELIDLGDTKLFEASVLPSIFIGKKLIGKRDTSAQFTRIYEAINSEHYDQQVEDIYEILSSTTDGTFKIGKKIFEKTTGTLTLDEKHWTLLSNEESEWVKKVDTNAKGFVRDYFKVRVGIKTTADNIFISNKWHEMGADKPEDELLKPLISQENIRAWASSTDDKLKVLYTHYSDTSGKRCVIDIERFPNARRYFLRHFVQLDGRQYVKDANRAWYEIWVPQNPDSWRLPKLVFPDISSEPRFCFDTDGRIVNGNCYWIVAEREDQEDLLLLLQGVANSSLMIKYHDLLFGNKLYSGKRRYISQYIERYPLPDIATEASREIIRLVRLLNRNNSPEQSEALQVALNLSVAKAFGI